MEKGDEILNLSKAKEVSEVGVVESVKKEENKENNIPVDELKKKQDARSSRLLVYSVIFIIILFISVVYYNQYSTYSNIDTVYNSITGEQVTGIVEDSYYFKNLEFKFVESLWYFTHYSEKKNQYYNIRLHYGPREAIEVPIIGQLGDKFINDDQVYLTFVPEYGGTKRNSYMTLAIAELSLNLVRAIDRKLVASCMENVTEACADRDIITCDNTDRAVIFIKYDDEAKVTFDGNCVIVQGKEKELTKAVDRLLLYWYEILDY
tara:strand:+ start:8891 stop:9679 length:789 start_codon:yes stop_codon:yes gene_type:complete